MDDYSFLKPITFTQTKLSLAHINQEKAKVESFSENTPSQSLTNEFKQLFSVMLMSMRNQSFSSFGLGEDSLNSQTQSNWGFSNQMLIMPLMLTLLEKIIQLEAQSNYSSLHIQNKDSSSIHVNQFDAEKQIGSDGINANCGPASLVIALHSLGLKVKGETENTSLGEVVDLARKIMVEDSFRDGVDANNQRADLEHNTFTNFSDLLRGARESGAKATLILPNAQSIQSALEKGGKVIVSGTFVDKDPLPWTGDSGNDNNSPPGFATQHIIAITAYDAKTNMFTIHDPARKNPHQVDGSTLEAFMSGNHGAMLLTK